MNEQATAEMREKEKGGSGGPGPAAGDTVNVEVTPKIVQGNNVYCEITRGQGTGENRVTGGVIKLSGTGPSTLNFALQAGDVSNLSWATDQSGNCNGFWSNANVCPAPNDQDSQVTGAPTTSGSIVTLTITPNSTLGRNVIHYALNFDQQGTALQFDPIIVVG